MKVGDFTPEKRDQLPKVSRDDLRIVWQVDYWDGPRSGVMAYRDQMVWFEVFDEPDEPDVFRRFLLIALTPEQLAEERYWNELFRKKVGTHWDYDDSGNWVRGSLRPKETQGEFYEPYRKRAPQDFSENEIIGWFAW